MSEWGAEWGAAWREPPPETVRPDPRRWGERETNEPGAAFLPIPVGALDTVAVALERLWKQFEGRATWEDLCEIIGECFGDVESLLHQVAVGRYRSTAFGVQLDELGALVGLPRGPYVDDELYRVGILIEASSMVGSGTVPEILDAVRAMGTITDVTELYADPDNPDSYPALRIRIASLTKQGFAMLRQAMKHLPPTGVRILLSTYLPTAVGGFGSVRGAVAAPATWSSVYGEVDDPLAHWSTAHVVGE